MKQKPSWRKPAVAALLWLTLVSWTCVTNPVTGKKELMLISEADEIAMGAQVHQGLEIEYGFYEAPDLTAYLRAVGNSLLPAVHRPHLKYHFHILDTPVQNAFAAPGGYIYITRGLLAMINSEAELAVVLGHELGHVNARHSARTLSRNILFGVGLVLASELNDDIRKTMPVVQIATSLLFLQYSRNDEYQADRLGIDYARSAGYSPGVMIEFFNSLEQLSAESGGGLPNFLSTHPLNSKRIEAVKLMLKSDDPQLKIEERTFLGRINNLAYGPSDEALRIDNGQIIAPRDGYAMTLAEGWQARQQSGIVTLVSADEQTVLMVKNGPADQPLTVLHRQQLENLNPLNILDQQASVIAGRQTQLTRAEKLENGQRAYGLQLLSLIHGQQGFGFYLLSEQAFTAERIDEVRFMVGSLRGIRRSDLPRGKRLQTRAAPGGRSLQDLFKAWEIPSSEWKTLAFLNRLPLDQPVRAGRLVKVIR